LRQIIVTRQSYKDFDRLAAIKHPERIVGRKITSARSLSKDIIEISVTSGGFGSVDNFINHLDVLPRIEKISKPFFFLSAKDDPFFGPDVIPTNHKSKNVLMGVTENGGHICYVEGLIPNGQWWTKPAF
jgi:predicted alpha/beta-fold hydrolase